MIMSVDVKSSHITPAEGNVFADLGFSLEEAARLHAASQQIITEKLAAEGSVVQDGKSQGS